jgi:hypothetical protein
MSKLHTMNKIAYDILDNFSKIKKFRHLLAILGMFALARLMLIPYLEGFEKIPHESTIQSIQLSEATGNILYGIHILKSDGYFSVEVQGFAFINREDAVDQETYIVLLSKDRTYVFDTMLREGLANHLKKSNPNLARAGFMAILPIRLIKNGEYQVAIYIRKVGQEALTYTDKLIVKFQGFVYTTLESRQVDFDLPEATGNIISKIERMDDIGQTYKLIAGWAFIDDFDTKDNEIYLVLQSERRTYFLEAAAKTRVDVTNSFSEKELDLDNSGFEVYINKRKRESPRIRSGDYHLGIYIRKGELEAFSWTNKIVRKTRGALEAVDEDP